MDKRFWKQFAIALVLFLLGYFTFNHEIFTGGEHAAKTSGGVTK